MVVSPARQPSDEMSRLQRYAEAGRHHPWRWTVAAGLDGGRRSSPADSLGVERRGCLPNLPVTGVAGTTGHADASLFKGAFAPPFTERLQEAVDSGNGRP